MFRLAHHKFIPGSTAMLALVLIVRCVAFAEPGELALCRDDICVEKTQYYHCRFQKGADLTLSNCYMCQDPLGGTSGRCDQTDAWGTCITTDEDFKLAPAQLSYEICSCNALGGQGTVEAVVTAVGEYDTIPGRTVCGTTSE
jgi:hypothetical protein